MNNDLRYYGNPMNWENVTGDLISRSALNEAIRKRLGISSLEYLTEQEKVIVDEIDNALTVDMNTELSVAYLKGRRQGQSEERPQGECKSCRHRDPEDKKCDCGGQERQGCPFPVSDDYYCKYYEKCDAG